MRVTCEADKAACSRSAAEAGLVKLRQTLAERGEANIILATGLSQFDLLHFLAGAPDLNWNRVNAFHLDEYVGLPISHPASFRLVLWKEFASKLPIPLNSFTWVDGEADPEAECRRLGEAIRARPVDVAFVGFGENGHLAFNDPPADFTTGEAYITVELDDACRRQQMGEGWFPTVADVPSRAISMSIRQIMRAGSIIATVPDERKARGVKEALELPVGNRHPAGILRCHPDVQLFLDAGSASLLAERPAPGRTREIPVESAPA
ncbi:MAG: glucosamine-6-phosphate deaminase [Planctomycetota bacterium]|jgi:glucosamine-6-phosphate deaminase|nr:glucosamine-6-phosphate deaminase [Planctomycetota bacterium]